MTYDVGDLVRIDTRVELASVLTDPTALAFTIKEPDGVITTKSWPADGQVVKDGVGLFHYNHTVVKPGNHAYRWAATGTVVSAEEVKFQVRRSEFV